MNSCIRLYGSAVLARLCVLGTILLFVSSLSLPAAEPAFPLADSFEYQVRGGLPNFFAGLEAGKEVRIAYIGGSITAQPGWRPKSTAWFKKQYPKAKIGEIDASIGGTTSTLGVFRLRRDVLEKQPDLLFIEFAANDGPSAPQEIIRSMEGMVRQTWTANPQTEICFVYTIVESLLKQMPEGKLYRSASAMEKVAAHYGIPTINMASEVVRLQRAGKLEMKGKLPKTDADKAALGGRIVFAADGIHPYYETGQQIYFEMVAKAMEAMRETAQVRTRVLPPPYAADNYERAKLLPVSRAKLSAGWRQLIPGQDPLATQFANRFPELWCARQPGATLTFRLKGTYAAVFGLLGPDNGQLLISLDDRPPLLKPNFDPWSNTFRPQYTVIGENLPNGDHTVTVTIAPDPADKAKILGRKIDDPEKYDGTAFYPGGIMIVGELVESP